MPLNLKPSSAAGSYDSIAGKQDRKARDSIGFPGFWRHRSKSLISSCTSSPNFRLSVSRAIFVQRASSRKRSSIVIIEKLRRRRAHSRVYGRFCKTK